MKNIYYTSSPFLSTILCDLFSSLNIRFRLIASNRSCGYEIPKYCLTGITVENITSRLSSSKINHIIIYDRHQEKDFIANLASFANIYYFRELNFGTDNLAEFARLSSDYPDILKIIGVKNYPPSHDIDWSSDIGTNSLKTLDNADIPIFEIPTLVVDDEVIIEANLRNLTYAEYAQYFASDRDKRTIDGWLKVIISNMQEINVLENLFSLAAKPKQTSLTGTGFSKSRKGSSAIKM